MIKKLLITISILLLLFGITASAEDGLSITAGDGFYIYGEDNQKVSDALSIEAEQIDSYCSDNNIRYLAVNKDNTKQIVLFCEENSFSDSVINISSLSDDKIKSLIPDIAGIENVNGEILKKGNQKFIKIQLRSADSGGDYLVTQYITVADRRNYILSFYTHTSQDTDYIEEVFETFDSPYFLKETKTAGGAWQYVILTAAILFALACAVIIITIIRDIRKNNSEVYAEQPQSAEDTE